MMKAFIFAFFILLTLGGPRSIAAHATKACVPQSSSIPTTQKNFCEIELNTLGCSEYAQTHGIDVSKLRRCDPPAPESDDESLLAGCEQGGRDLTEALQKTWDHLLGVGEEMAEAARLQKELIQNCESDKTLSIKRQLFEDGKLEGVTKPVTESDLENLSCNKLMQDVEARKNFSEFQSLANKLDDPQFKKDWDVARKNWAAAIVSSVKQNIDKAGIIWNCYTPKAKAEIFCAASPVIAFTAVSGGVALWRLRAFRAAGFNSSKALDSTASAEKVAAVDSVETASIPEVKPPTRRTSSLRALVKEVAPNSIAERLRALRGSAVIDIKPPCQGCPSRLNFSSNDKHFDSHTWGRQICEGPTCMGTSDMSVVRSRIEDLAARHKADRRNVEVKNSLRTEIEALKEQSIIRPKVGTTAWDLKDRNKILDQLHRLDLKTVGDGVDANGKRVLEGEYQGTKFRVVVCEGQCPEGVAKGDVVTIFPLCGPRVMALERREFFENKLKTLDDGHFDSIHQAFKPKLCK